MEQGGSSCSRQPEDTTQPHDDISSGMWKTPEGHHVSSWPGLPEDIHRAT